ncbi:hypothetical protein AWE51_23915 [Aquimarina aggregata]|uniref:Uncharacterized protein n=1 Tax=Aquimarina aggregata TaxID=1642818 RepID=A0A163B240_9FLAO|nr:hypothetical protein [Aquimarina aggregata]KZS41002.1 hypothetical protein AWE51_23915 [Aquimarina aggregata]
MKRTPQIFDKIESYIAGSLSKEELIAFEKEISLNPELSQEVEKHKSLHAALSDPDTIAFKKKLIKISAAIKEEETASSSFFSAPWKIAASIIVILSIGALVWNYTGKTVDTQDLYLAYYTPFLTEDTTRGKTDTQLQDIIENYNNKDYETVIGELEKLPNLDRKEKLQLYLGNSYLNTNQEEKAITVFEDFEKDSKFYEVAKWYLSLTYLKLDKKNIVISVLDEIIAYDGIYKIRALQLKEAL